MATYSNTGKLTALSVKGNPESFQSLIRNHGILVKIKQALVCTCVATNSGSADFNCDICNGEGYIYTYQRRFLVADENSPSRCGKLYPFWTPILAVEKIQNVTSAIQGGITELTVDSFTDSEITVAEDIVPYEQRKVTYYFDGWTYVESEQLQVDVANGLMYANGTNFDSGYQSSNPLGAYADIARIVRIWNTDTGVELSSYTFSGKTIHTTETIVANKMYIEYYYADMTQAIPQDLATQDNVEVWMHSLTSGETKMAFYPFWDLAKGDLITIAATVLWKNELMNHTGDMDKLFEIEIFQLNNIILDESGNTYYIDTDYILQGRYIRWISANKPKIAATMSVRYAYKPSFVIFEDNVQENNLENKVYPKTCLVKSWSKTTKDDVKRLIYGDDD